VEFEIGDNVVYPHHGAGKVLRKEVKDVLGESREYLTVKILHNDMTVMVPTENAQLAGLRRVIDEETVKKVLAVLQDECSEMPKNWNRRFKHNRDKIKTGDIYELAEVVRNLAIREAQKGLSTGEKQMFTRAKKILSSELMYALEMDEQEVDRETFNQFDTEFHVALADAGGNRLMSDVTGAIRESVRMPILATMTAMPETGKRGWPRTLEGLRADHHAIFTAVEAGLGEQAADRLEAHIRGFSAHMTTAS